MSSQRKHIHHTVNQLCFVDLLTEYNLFWLWKELPITLSILFYLILSCSILFYLVLSYSILFYLVLSCSILFYLVLSCSILFYLVLSCSILFYLILSRQAHDRLITVVCVGVCGYVWVT